jgi:hypothetical protein
MKGMTKRSDGNTLYNASGSWVLGFNQSIDNITKVLKIMSQLIDPLPTDYGRTICCCYVNTTSKIQVARITNIPNWYFERVVFPGQRLLFESLSDAQLEIHTGMMASAILSDTIPCARLQVIEEEGFSFRAQDQQQVEERNEQRPHMQIHPEMLEESRVQLTV